MDSPEFNLSDELSIESILQTDDRAPSHSLSDHISGERGTRIQLKRVDKIRNPENRFWELRDTVQDTTTENQKKSSDGRYDRYADYAFIVRRKVIPSRNQDEEAIYLTKVFVWSRWLRSILQDILKEVPSIPWTAQPLKLDPKTLLAHLSPLKKHLNLICPGNSFDIESEERQITAQHLQLLIGYLESDYAPTIQKLKRLLSHHEITWDLLWAIFLPCSTILATCPVTSERRAYKLRDIQQSSTFLGSSWKLDCEYVETCTSNSHEKTFGWASYSMAIDEFKGKKKIEQLSVYPIQWDPQPQCVQDFLNCRGSRWASIPAVHHMQISGFGYENGIFGEIKYNVLGRVMVDRATFASVQPNRNIPKVTRTVKVENKSSAQPENLDFFLYASPVLYGFDLSDKRWLLFNVQNISEIHWNHSIFKNLTVDHNTKTVLRSLIEVHAHDRPFDDFVEGKGLGLVVNLFGPPGVGKSLTVEAISEHLRRPLYVVGAGDLGTDAPSVDRQLKKILSLIPKWNAILLIDEADVFLEKRGTHDLKRNALVAVFLREIEYFRGILFLTTNRAKEFDPAFQSRIDLSLHYKDLNLKTRTQLWIAFLNKARDNPYGIEELSTGEMNHLARQNLNGRQIKNVVKVATSLARFEKTPLGYDHVVRTLGLGEYPADGGYRERGYSFSMFQKTSLSFIPN